MDNTTSIDDALLRARDKAKGFAHGESLSAVMMENLLGEQELMVQICGLSTDVIAVAPIIKVKVLFKLKHLESCQSVEETFETLCDLQGSLPVESSVVQGIAACKQLYLESKLGLMRGFFSQGMAPYPAPSSALLGQANSQHIEAINRLTARTL